MLSTSITASCASPSSGHLVHFDHELQLAHSNGSQFSLYVSGIMVARWGVLWKPLEFSLKNDLKLLRAIIRLHNFCMDNSIRRGEENSRQVDRTMILNTIAFAPPSDDDAFGERLQDENFETAPPPRNPSAVHVDRNLNSIDSGDDSRRQSILLTITALNLQRPANLRIRASDLTL